MDFFEQQRRAKTKTGLLLAYFGLAVVGLVLTLYLIFSVAFVWIDLPDRVEIDDALAENPWLLWDPQRFLLVTGIAIAVIVISSAIKTAELSSGGGAVATSLGARHITQRPADIKELQLYHVVEEMAIASGTPRPELYILDNESTINAFAAGFSPGDAAICVTRGCLQQLSRDELQGVIAHEFSHILNGDMRINTRLIGILAGILSVAIIGRIAFELGLRATRGGDSKKGNPAVIMIFLGLAVMIVGYIGLLFGRLIKAAISREREYLADASAVQFTRNPLGILGALAKVSTGGSHIQSSHAEEASHMFFANGLGEFWIGSMATHPPIQERMGRIDPSGAGLKELAAGWDRQQADAAARLSDPNLSPTPQSAQGGKGTGAFPINPVALVVAASASTGASERHLSHACKLLDQTSPQLIEAARDPSAAAALILSLLVDPENREVRAKQMQAIGSLHPAIADEARRLAPIVAGISRHQRLMLIDLAIPALRQLSRNQYQDFRQKIQDVARADEAVDLFEFVLERVVERHLDRHFGITRPPKVQYRQLEDVLEDAVALLSVLAHVGQSGDDVEAAFRRGASQLATRSPAAGLRLLAPEECGLDVVSRAIDRISASTPLIKKNILFACATTVMASGEANEDEAEILRAIADSLDAPIPPFVPSPCSELPATA
jgi:Zn-dependent protease with chaperone function